MTSQAPAARPFWLLPSLRELVADPDHGSLPAVLLGLTVVTGVVDAVSILALGRVFVANMTGNVVFVGFAVAGAPGFSLAGSLSALAGFVVGALIGGRLTRSIRHRLRLMRSGLVLETVLLTVALIVIVTNGGVTAGSALGDVTAALLAVALGVQNAVVRALKVPDLTTTVLTMTLTGIFSDVRTEPPTVALRRGLAVLAMFGGAALGAVLVLDGSVGAALGVAVGLLAAGLVVVIAAVGSRVDPEMDREPDAHGRG